MSAVSVKRVPGVVAERCSVVGRALLSYYSQSLTLIASKTRPFPWPAEWSNGPQGGMSLEQLRERSTVLAQLKKGIVWVPPPFSDHAKTALSFYVDEEVVRKPVAVPLMVHRSNVKHRDFWQVGSELYATHDQELVAKDVLALINEVANRRRLQLEKAHALAAMTSQMDERSRRQTIPPRVKLLVWQRDGGRCVDCGAQENLEFDHVIPLAMGGSNTDRNLQLLCDVCNRRKGATLG